jgi:hypothetical protein
MEFGHMVGQSKNNSKISRFGRRMECGRMVGQSKNNSNNFRFGRPMEFGHMVVAIAENAYMNGETVRLDAGVRMPKL